MWRRRFISLSNDSQKSIGGRGSDEISTRGDEIDSFRQAGHTMTSREDLERSYSSATQRKNMHDGPDCNEKKTIPSREMYFRGNVFDVKDKEDTDDGKTHNQWSQRTLTTVDSGSGRLNNSRHFSDGDVEPDPSLRQREHHDDHKELIEQKVTKDAYNDSTTPTSSRKRSGHDMDSRYGNLGVGGPVDDDTAYTDTKEPEKVVKLAPLRDFAQASVNRHSLLSKERYGLKPKGNSSETIRLELAAEPTDVEVRITPGPNAKGDATEPRIAHPTSNNNLPVDYGSDVMRGQESESLPNETKRKRHRRCDQTSRDGSSAERTIVSRLSSMINRALASMVPPHRLWTIRGKRDEEVPQPERIHGDGYDEIQARRIWDADEGGPGLNPDYISESQPAPSVDGYSDVSPLTTSTVRTQPNNTPLPNVAEAEEEEDEEQHANPELQDMGQEQAKDRNRAMSFVLILPCLLLVAIIVVVVVVFVLPQFKENQADGNSVDETNAPSSGPTHDTLSPPTPLFNDVWTNTGEPYISQADLVGFGRSVSLSSSGSVVAIASLNTTIVTQYSALTNTWEQVGSSVAGSVVSMSDDGRTIAVQNLDSVIVYRYLLSEQAWRQLGQAISMDNVRIHSFALAKNGLVLAVGGAGYNILRERTLIQVFQYDRVNFRWEEAGGYIDTPYGIEVQVELSIDGTLLGAATRTVEQGLVGFEALFYELDRRVWRKLTQAENGGSVSVGHNEAVLGFRGGKLTHSSFATTGVDGELVAVLDTEQTPDVAISTDGNVVAACWESHAEVWRRTEGSWLSRGRWSESSGFAVTSISLASNGNSIAIGVAGENTGGFVSVYSSQSD